MLQARSQYEDVFSQLGSQTIEKSTIQEELGEAHEMIAHMEQEMNRVQEDHLQDKGASSMAQTLLENELKVFK